MSAVSWARSQTLVAAVVFAAGIPIRSAEARHHWDGLTSRAVRFVILSARSGAASLGFVLRNDDRHLRPEEGM
jgi:hypothetical protein